MSLLLPDRTELENQRLHERAEAKKDFAFETTLASRSYAGWLTQLRESSDYRVSIVFLWLPVVELAIERVETRVRIGGHSIPEVTIRRRFERGIENFFELYLPVANSWRVFNSSEYPPEEIARYTEESGRLVFDHQTWNQIKR